MHKIKACVITCIDFRFQKMIKKYMEMENLLGESDIISIAGSSHDLATPESKENMDYLLKQLRISVTLHHPDEIILIDHQDCGMYAETGKIPHDLELSEDIEKHTPYLHQAKVIISNKFPGLPVRLVFAGKDASFKVIG